MNDIISDTLTRIRNSQRLKSPYVYLYTPTSKICINLLNILYKEGYIRGYKKILNKNNQIKIKVLLKYTYDNKPLIKKIQKISKSSKRVYISIKSLWKIKNGLGILIISTNKGLMTDNTARLLNCGGEIICQIQ